ncbi:MAG: type IX secretion system membrane protein PorP/SprF [Lutibacter sp.]|nr:type IX secretion system membrane protein PorP/SprF [Lutibacter sp.]
MNKRKLLLSISTLLFTVLIFGQQDAQYTQYMYNMNVLNPAYAGSKGVTSIGLLGRTQWVGIEGAPQTLTLSLHSPIANQVGLGFSVIHDEIGPVKEDNVYADFSYTVNTSMEGRLAFGLKAGVTFLGVRELTTVDPDPLNDPINIATPNFGAGIFYYTNKFYLGLSAPNLLETRHLEKNSGQTSSASEKAHYFFTTGYVFDINDHLKFKPSTMIKAASGAPLSVDLSTNILIQEKFEIGVSYRLEDSISAMVGINVSENFRIGYAYDQTVSNLEQFNTGSHEILLLFDFNRRNIKSPRFF